ncbi:MAG: hypothetical protein AAGB19_17880, partial [Cyanobacteria bacterium P01_F01_bin.3]
MNTALQKPWYKSHTILAALSAFGVTISGIANTAIAEQRLPDRAELLVIGGAYLTLQETVRGRLKAAAKIGKGITAEEEKPATETPEEPETLETSKPVPIEPEPVQYADGEIEVPPEVLAILNSSPDDAPAIESSQLSDLDSIDNEENDLDIDLEKLKGKYYLIAGRNTKLKTSPEQSSQLSSVDFMEISKADKIEIDGWSFPDTPNGHIEVIIDEYSSVNQGKFYVYVPHFKLF